MSGTTDPSPRLDPWVGRLRRTAVVVALLLAAASLAPWWSRRADGAGFPPWTGPHFAWAGVLLCLGVVVLRTVRSRDGSPSSSDPGRGDRWAAVGAASGTAIAGWGWLAEHAGLGAAPAGSGPDQLAWVLTEQGAGSGVPGRFFDVAWGYPIGLALMALIVALFATAAVLLRQSAAAADDG